jgi:hypothetical protein
MNAPLDLTGQRYGRLVAISRAPNRGRRTYWLFKCDCGNEKEIGIESVRSGSVESCKCLLKEVAGQQTLKHGHAKGYTHSRTYRAWLHAKERCFNPNSEKYPWYGARGITMCEEWKNDFSAFLRDMGECPEGLTIDRIDPNGHYEPGNCRWATDPEQRRTRTDNVWVEHEGQRMILTDFAALMGVDYQNLQWHVHRMGRDPHKAVDHMLHNKGKKFRG